MPGIPGLVLYAAPGGRLADKSLRIEYEGDRDLSETLAKIIPGIVEDYLQIPGI
jgi:hypothetical protein